MSMVRGSINVGQYKDGSAKFDVEWDLNVSPSIFVEQFSDCWISLDIDAADELCRAIKRAAKHIRQSLSDGEKK